MRMVVLENSGRLFALVLKRAREGHMLWISVWVLQPER